MADHDNDDLDALLDEAMDIVDEQEREHEEQAKERDARLEEDLKKALDESSGGGGADLVKMFQSLLGASTGEGGMPDDATFETFKSDVAQLVSTLEGVGDLKDEDKANLDRVKELMSVLDTEDEGRAQELLNEMKTDGVPPLPESDGKPADLDAAFKNCVDALQQISGPTPVTTAASVGAGSEPSAVPGSAAGNENGDGSVPDNIATMLLEAILDPDFVEPIKVMRDAYEPYLSANAETISVTEREIYIKQHNKTIEICEFLIEPIHREDDARVTRLLELMHEFSELGEPPKNLPDYAPKKTA